MTKKEFEHLRRQIHKKEFELIELQKLHRQETGRDYVVSGSLPEPEEEVKAMLETYAEWKALLKMINEDEPEV